MSTSSDQMCQVYRAQDMVRIYRTTENTFYGERNNSAFPMRGYKVPAAISLPCAAVRWSKREVWESLGITDDGGVTIKVGDMVRSKYAAEMLAISTSTIHNMINEGKVKGLRVDRDHVIPVETITTWVGGPPRVWPKEVDDPAFRALDRSARQSAPAESSEPLKTADEVVATILDKDIFKELIHETFSAVLLSHGLRLKLIDETIEAIGTIVGKEVRESVGRSLTSGVVEAVLSDQDVTRVAEAARNAVRETLIVRNPDLTPPPMPPTTALRDRVRGAANGR